MIGKFKRKIAGKVSNILKSAVRREIENVLPIIPSLIALQDITKEDRQSFYNRTKDFFGIYSLFNPGILC